MPYPTRFSPEEDLAIGGRYADGESAGAIARDLGATDSAVLTAIRRAGVPVRSERGRRPPTDAQRAEILRLFDEEGLQQKEIASLHHFDRSTVRRVIKEAGRDPKKNGNYARSGERHGMWKGGRGREGQELRAVRGPGPFDPAGRVGRAQRADVAVLAAVDSVVGPHEPVRHRRVPRVSVRGGPGAAAGRGVNGKTYLERGEPVTVICRWAHGNRGVSVYEPPLFASPVPDFIRRVTPSGWPVEWHPVAPPKGLTGPRNVLIERGDGTRVVRPFRGLRVPENQTAGR